MPDSRQLRPRPLRPTRIQACVETLWPAAKAAGVTRATFDVAFQGFTPDPTVVEAANFQPEYVKPIGEYIDRVVSDKRIATGKQKLDGEQGAARSAGEAIRRRTAYHRRHLGGRVEFGTQSGDKNVIRSLGTLIAPAPRPSSKPQLVSALKILQQGDIKLEAMNGSWAGAMDTPVHPHHLSGSP